MSKKRAYQEGEKKAEKPSGNEKRQPSNERYRSNSSRPGYLQPKDKKGTSRVKSVDERTNKGKEREIPYGKRNDSGNSGRAESRPRFFQPKDDNSGSVRGEKSNADTRKGKPSYGKEGRKFTSEKAGKASFSKDRYEKPSFGRGEDKRSSFRKNPDKRSFGNNNEVKPSYSKGRDSIPSNDRGEDKRGSYRRDSDEKPFKQNRESKPFDSKGRDSRPFNDRGEEKKGSYRRESDEKPFKQNKESKSSFSKGRDSRPSGDRGENKRGSYRTDSDEKPLNQARTGKPARDETKGPRKPSLRKYPDQNEGYKKPNFEKKSDERKPRTRKTEASIGIDKNKGNNTQTKGEIRLNRFIANAGICSRRDADLLIQAGEITVNGEVVTEMGYKVKYSDEIRYNKRRLKREKLVYVLLNKPKDFITTTDDPENRKTIMQLVESAGSERIYPVGRLDRNTTGLILLTNDGELADKLSHPSHNIKKLYQVDLDKPISDEDFEKITLGVTLEDGVAEVDQIALVSSDKTSLGLQIHSGKNRIVRRIFEHLGYDVIKLDRVMYAGLDKKDLPRGKWRYLSEQEVIRLKYLK